MINYIARLFKNNRLLLSHHGYYEFDRCFLIKTGGEEFYVCARCTGLYVGIIAGIAILLGHSIILVNAPSIVMIFGLPSIAFLDWGLYMLGVRRGSNFTRAISGFCLGIACWYYLVALIINKERWFVILGVVFWILIYNILLKRMLLNERE
jgi:uncharacterized membrane protein